MKDITEKLLARFPTAKQHEPLSKQTNFRMGGPARWFVEGKTIDDVMDAVALAQEQHVPYFILGGGSNTLAKDGGFDGLVIKMAMRGQRIDGNRVMADAGVIMVSLARATVQAGLSGLEWAVSLPGTVGGAVRGNAGCFGGETKDSVESVRVLRAGKVVELAAKDLAFGYRTSAIKHSDDIVLRATFILKPSDPDALKQRAAEILEKRKATQPISTGSAGCIFKNYEIRTMEEWERLRAGGKIPSDMLDRHMISAGWAIDKAGLKGTAVGPIVVSDTHGNFCLNMGGGTSAQLSELVRLIKERVQEEFGILLEEEVQYLGTDA